MKKETSDKKDKNQVIWEEFVSKNSIKKNFSTGIRTRFNDLKIKERLIVEKLISRPNTGKNTVTAARKSYLKKSIISSISPKIDLVIEKNRLRRIKNGKISIEGTLLTARDSNNF